MKLIRTVPHEDPRPTTKPTMQEPQEEFIAPEPTVPVPADAAQATGHISESAAEEARQDEDRKT